MTPTPFLLDSGTVLSYLPIEVFNSLRKTSFPKAYFYESLGFIVDCSLRYGSNTFDVNFGGYVAHVKYSDFILTLADWQRKAYQLAESDCLLGASFSTSDYILGQTFLSSVYGEFIRS